MKEYVKYNCHVMAVNEVGTKSPDVVMKEYVTKRVNGADYVFDGVDCVVVSVNYAPDRARLITKISRKDDYENLRSEQKS